MREWLRENAEQWCGRLSRVVRRRGRERETAVIIVKCVIASTAAWAVGALLVDSPQVGFAPFSALLMVRPSVYGSVLQAARYVPAVFVGALIAGVSGLPLPLDLWVFALAVLVAMVLGQLPVFGEQGQQIPVVASFALAGGTADNLTNLGTLLLMVLVGAVSAVLTNMVFAPAIRFRDAENAVLDFADSLAHLARQMADGFREGRRGLHSIGYWRQNADGFDDTARNARESVSEQEYRMRMNPRRLLDDSPVPGAPVAYRDWITALSRASWHLQSLTRTLSSARSSNSRFPEPSDDFLRDFAPLLDASADALETVRQTEEPARETFSADLSACLEEGFHRISRARERIDEYGGGELWSVHSAMLTDLARLFEELYAGHEDTEWNERDSTA
ncbi:MULTISPECIES: aromatic acid exporter family protein [unclassified Nocardiopsis]|uniref:FUSC family protein n=1 Tax=unclassified Nocardiopsis TaxID=2649073 RepID=UPI001F1AF3AE|nr:MULTISPECIES: aromatic acid exporter family protein [unclassified Nocardiopsis]